MNKIRIFIGVLMATCIAVIAFIIIKEPLSPSIIINGEKYSLDEKYFSSDAEGVMNFILPNEMAVFIVDRNRNDKIDGKDYMEVCTKDKIYSFICEATPPDKTDAKYFNIGYAKPFAEAVINYHRNHVGLNAVFSVDAQSLVITYKDKFPIKVAILFVLIVALALCLHGKQQPMGMIYPSKPAE